MERTLYVLTGPTAVGKTEKSIQWALEREAEILSCDSLLIYRGMDIGTAKPSKEERSLVPHHGIDLVDCEVPFSVKAFQDYAWEKVQEIHQRGKEVLITGGSGFYLKSFFAPVVDEVPVSKKVRTEVQALQKKGIRSLIDSLKSVNPEGLGNLDLQNPRRVAKALERCWGSGKSLLELQATFAEQKSPFSSYQIKATLLQRSRESLHKRAELRIEKMWKNGLIEEVKQLKSLGIENNPSASGAIGYREVLAYLEEGNPLTAEQVKEQILFHTRQLIRKQETWFRKQIPFNQKMDLD